MTVPFVDIPRLHTSLREELLEAFARVVDSGGYVQGREVAAFEAEFAATYGVPHALAVSNGTVALQLALAACDVGRGDEVITVANTFIATAEAITAVGATPVFAEIAPGTHLIDVADVERKITPKTRAIIAVHLYGEIAQMHALKALAERHGIWLIEDACQAHGASVGGQRAGTIGDVGCLSFYPTKNLGTVGEGGMVLTSDPELAESVASLRDHGQRGRHNHVEPGINGRMPELQAAALRVFLPHLRRWNEQRVAVARRYAVGLRETHLDLPRLPKAGEHVFHLYVVQTPYRAALQEHLGNRGINTAIHYPFPIHLQPAYASCTSGPGALPVTEETVRQILSLPMHPEMTAAEVDEVCRAVREFDVLRGFGPKALMEVGS